jgi:hypothetical protein
MNTNGLISKKIGIVVLALTTCLMVHGGILYSNLNTPAALFNSEGHEIGDQIILADNGFGATITDFSFEFYAADVDPLAQYTISLYANDGVAGVPSTPLWTDTAAFVNGSDYSQGVLVGYSDLGIAVPHSFTWAIDFSNLGVGNAGLILSTSGGPTVGGNYNDYWLNNNGTWQLNYIEGSDVSFLAAFSGTPVVPEPASMALMGMGSLGLFLLKRRSARLSK